MSATRPTATSLRDDTRSTRALCYRQVGAGDSPTEPELHAFCRDHLAAYKTPVTWIFVDAFLPIASGKARSCRCPKLRAVLLTW